jgi:hypothetical protein
MRFGAASDAFEIFQSVEGNRPVRRQSHRSRQRSWCASATFPIYPTEKSLEHAFKSIDNKKDFRDFIAQFIQAAVKIDKGQVSAYAVPFTLPDSLAVTFKRSDPSRIWR